MAQDGFQTACHAPSTPQPQGLPRTTSRRSKPLKGSEASHNRRRTAVLVPERPGTAPCGTDPPRCLTREQTYHQGRIRIALGAYHDCRRAVPNRKPIEPPASPNLSNRTPSSGHWESPSRVRVPANRRHALTAGAHRPIDRIGAVVVSEVLERFGGFLPLRLDATRKTGQD